MLAREKYSLLILLTILILPVPRTYITCPFVGVSMLGAIFVEEKVYVHCKAGTAYHS